MGWRRTVVARLRREIDARPGAAVGLFARGARSRAVLRDIYPGAVWIEPSAGAVGDLSIDDGSLTMAIVWLAGVHMHATTRRQLLQGAGRALRGGGELIIIDHNRPRRLVQRVANFGWCLAVGVNPWERPAYPVAREAQALGFDVYAARLTCAERVQIVCARRDRLDTVRGVL